MKNEIECMECGYIGQPDIEDDGSKEGIWWCPNCESCFIIINNSEEHYFNSAKE